MNSDKILIIGYFGYVSNQLDGQTVKTRNIYKILSEKYKIDIFDTEKLKYNKLSIIILFFKIFSSKKIIFMGGKNNLSKFFPILFRISKILNLDLIYIVVGGWLYDFLKDNGSFLPILKQTNAILVETKYLQDALIKLGVNKVQIIPNFRMVSYPIKYNLKILNSDCFRMVFMARIVKEKGIYLIFQFLEEYKKNINSFSKKITIDFYGPIDPKDKCHFFELVQKFSSFVRYKGILDPDNIYKILPDYDVLLLPTFYQGEGFPGTILDAYLSGVPVIATRWKQIPEFVEDNITGFLIEYDVTQLSNKINYLINNPNEAYQMKLNAIQKSKFYSYEIALEIIDNILD